MRFFPTPLERQIRQNKKQLDRAISILEERKFGFRNNAVSKLSFIYPDMKFAICMTSKVFAGYSKDRNQCISGEFLDEFLPSISVLRRLVGTEEFEHSFISFIQNVQHLRYEGVSPEKQGEGYSKSYDLDIHRAYIRKYGDQGFNYNEQYFPYDVHILKNDRIVGRFAAHSPKHMGYFSERVYESIIQDTQGKGVSVFSIELHLWNFGDLWRRRIDFVYSDPPRNSQTQMRDHLMKTCAQFLPFLQVIEEHLSSPELREEIGGLGSEMSDRDLGLR